MFGFYSLVSVGGETGCWYYTCSAIEFYGLKSYYYGINSTLFLSLASPGFFPVVAIKYELTVSIQTYKPIIR